jgi:hypothetical protein
MTAEDAIHALLLQDPAVSILVKTRVYPVDEQPQAGAYPRVTFQRISTTGRPLLAGDDEELPGVRLQINCLGETRTQARALTWAVRALFANGRGSSAMALARVDGHGDLPRESDTRIHGTRLDLLVTMAAAEAA